MDWGGFGFEGTKLGYLVGQSGWFHNGHRATDDCHALLEVLAATLPGLSGSALGHLPTRSGMAHVRIWAEGAPYDLKDQLKQRGYRWSDGSDGQPRAWWVEVEEGCAETKIAYLEGEIYMRRVRPRAQRIAAWERYKKPQDACEGGPGASASSWEQLCGRSQAVSIQVISASRT